MDRSSLLILGAYASLTQALLVNNGDFAPDALVLALLALVLLLVAGIGAGQSGDPARRDGSKRGHWVLLALLGYELARYAGAAPSPTLRVPDYTGAVFWLAASAAGLTGLLAVLGKIRPGPRALGVVIAAAALGGVYMLQIALGNHLDVHVHQQEGAEALFQGQNPYATTYTDIYGGQAPFKVFPESYPYPPQQLLITAPVWALTGDVRWGSLLAMLLAAVGAFRLARLRWPDPGDPTPLLGAAVLAFFPRGLMVLERAWTEPYLLAALVWAVIACARGQVRWGGFLTGVALGLKQYSVVLLAPLLLLRPKPKAAGIALLTGLVALAPFLIWGPAELISDLTYPLPLRTDSLSVGVVLNERWGWHPPLWGVTLASLALGGVWLARARPSPAATLHASASALLLLFLFGPKGHLNYFYLIAGVMLLAAIAPRMGEVEPPEEAGSQGVSPGDACPTS